MVVLEHLDNVGNRAAILRSVEAFGFLKVYEVGRPLTECNARTRNIINGGEKWLNVEGHDDMDSCVAAMRRDGVKQILAAMPPSKELGGRISFRLDELDLSCKTALVFGNETRGVAPAAVAQCDGCFHIPLCGLSESLNVSVAVAVSLYAVRQRRTRALSLGADDGDLSGASLSALKNDYLGRAQEGHYRRNRLGSRRRPRADENVGRI